MSNSAVLTNQKLSDQTVIGPIFNQRRADINTCSVNKANAAGSSLGEVPAGTVHAKTYTGKWQRCAADTIEAAAATATLTLKESMNAPASQFKVGDELYVEGVDTAYRITAVDPTAKQVTIDTAITADADTVVYVDPSKSVALVDALGVAGLTLTFSTAGHGARFRVGDSLNIPTVGVREVTAVDADTITVDGANFTTAGQVKVTSQARGKYRISDETYFVEYYAGHAPGNVVMNYCPAGEVFSKRVRGMTDAMRAVLANRIDFTDITPN